MGKTITIEAKHIARIEGHGTVVLNAEDGKVRKVQWQVPEAPRFFEAMLVGRDYHELSHITSRICGICSISHSLASLRATENAMGVKVSEQTKILRKLAKHCEMLQSHILHVGYLVAPDLFNVGSVIPLVATHKEVVLKIIKIHRLANELSDLMCGRTTHPIFFQVGGFSRLPIAKELSLFKARLEDAVKDAFDVVDIVLNNAGALPDFTRETEYVALTTDDCYDPYDAMIGSSDTGKHKIEDYQSITNEYVVPHSTAKYTKHKRDSYMVGALARFNLNHAKLSPLGKKVAEKFNLKAPCHKPFLNSVAQLAELANSMEESIQIIDKLIKVGIKQEKIEIKIREGRGVGAVEAPRGILFHDYTIDKNGKCVKANCVIPTNQNHANIQKDMEAFAPTLLDKDQKEITHNLEMLVRAYDPCVSCSTHYLKVTFV
jgi:coenzyme F420-reducing hydrogenase alpha subunit